jgi:hypothetical protein
VPEHIHMCGSLDARRAAAHDHLAGIEIHSQTCCEATAYSPASTVS